MNEGIDSQGFYADEQLILPNDKVDQEYFVKQRYTAIAQNINQREIAIYPLIEIETGQKYYTPGNPRSYRTVFRKVLPIGNVTGGTSGPISHGISQIARFTRIYGTAYDPLNGQYYMLPYADAAGTGNIEIVVTDSTVTINGGASAPNLIETEIILEYIKV